MTATEHRAAASDGTGLSYLRWNGGGATRRLVLVHALAMRGRFWAATAEALGSDWDVIAIDCRGHGASDRPGGPYTVALMADDVAAVMDDAGWESAVVAGASMGGCVALAFAAAHPARCSGLGLFDTTACYGESAPQDWEERAQKAVDGGMAALVGFQKTRWFSDDFRAAHPEAVEDAVSIFLANDVPVYVETCRMLGRADLRAALPSFSMPVEIAVGAEDYATPPAMAEALAHAIEGSRMTVIPAVRHFTPLEVPEAIAARLRDLGERAYPEA